MRGLRSGQPTNMQAFFYYRMRCVLAGDLAKEWGEFGGITGQLNLLGIALCLAIAESPFVAMEYGRVKHQRLAALARDRYMDNNPGLDFFAILSKGQTEVTRNIAASSNAFLRYRHPAGPRAPNDTAPPRGSNDAAKPKNVPTGEQPPPVSEVKGKYGPPKGGNKRNGKGNPP